MILPCNTPCNTMQHPTQLQFDQVDVQPVVPPWHNIAQHGAPRSNSGYTTDSSTDLESASQDSADIDSSLTQLVQEIGWGSPW